METPIPIKAKTDDNGKPPLARLPLKALRIVAKVQLYGAQKYGDYDNYRKGMEITRNASCAMRHIADFIDGNDIDQESNLNHLAHAACRLLFILENLEDGTAIDDRYRHDLTALEAAHARITELERTIEDVCCGTRIKCALCGQTKPCICDHGENEG